MDHWPYAEPPNEAVLTTQEVREGDWIFQVSRDECGTPEGRRDLREEDGRLVSLIWGLDPGVADLPHGWLAWRKVVGQSGNGSRQGGTTRPGWKSWLTSLWPLRRRPR